MAALLAALLEVQAWALQIAKFLASFLVSSIAPSGSECANQASHFALGLTH